MSAQKYSIMIDLRWCLDELLADRVIDQRGYNLVMTSRRDKDQHPLLPLASLDCQMATPLVATQSKH